MSNEEIAARYEHATTTMDWNAADPTSPVPTPPSADLGWMLLYQHSYPHQIVLPDGERVTRFLLTWRRRVQFARAKPEPKPKAARKGKKEDPHDDPNQPPGWARAKRYEEGEDVDLG